MLRLMISVLLVLAVAACASLDTGDSGTIMTVQGPIKPSELGPTLSHEHIAGAFVNLDDVGPLRYDRDRIVATMAPLLVAVRERGFRSVVETTPADLGRDVVLLRRLAESTGVNIITNTGNYGAFGDALTLAYAKSESADQLAARWVAEFNEGIAGTGIRPGFIKTAVDPGPTSNLDRKLLQAAARTHLQTGLTILVHTGEAEAARGALSVVLGEGVDPAALVIVHADEIAEQSVHFELAEAGAWIAYDHIGRPGLSTEKHVELIAGMIDRGYGAQLLLSHDSVWWNLPDPEGWMQFGEARLHPALGGPWGTSLSDELIPALRAAGVSDGTVAMIIEDNPAAAFTIGVRARS